MPVNCDEAPHVLVVDDEEKLRSFLARALTSMGFRVSVVCSGSEGIATFAESSPDLALVDLKLDDLDGIEVVRQVHEASSDAALIVMTGYGSIQTAVEAMRAGALDYLTKPLDIDHLEIVLKRVLDSRRQAAELHLLRSQLEEHGSFQGLVGVSPAMQKIYDLIERVAPSDLSVLIQGETGTGKELVAKAIHNLSARSDTVMMPINCGALPETILESELFGHEKGAFTGASRQKFGLIEQADGGTLFLDEIEEMSPALQVKLLRAVQEGEVLRVGGSRPLKVDFRLITTTNVNLQERLDQGAFRPDLYYRINSVVLDLPPLRERRSDIPLLAPFFVSRYANRAGVTEKEMEPEVMMVLRSYGWPGNVRELENVVERAMLMCQGETIGLADLPENLLEISVEAVEGDGLYELPFRGARARFEKTYLMAALDRADGRVADAAGLAGINRQHFYEKMKRYGIPRNG